MKEVINPVELQDIISKYEDVYEANYDYTKRVNTSFKLYSQLNPSEIIKNKYLKELVELGLDPKVYNFIERYVDGHAGNFLNFIISPAFVPSKDKPELRELSKALALKFDHDNNVFNYTDVIREAIFNGCIINGIIELKLCKTRDNPNGYVKMNSIFPNRILFDTSVVDSDIALHSKYCFAIYKTTPKVVKDKYPDSEPYIAQYLERRFSDYTSQEVDAKTKSNFYDVVMDEEITITNYYHIKSVKKTVDVETNGKKDSVVYFEDELWVTVFSSNLNYCFEHGKDERQIKTPDGKCRLPFYTFSFNVSAGVPFAIPDKGQALQEDINLREINKAKTLHNMPQGKYIVHPLAYGNDPNKRDNFTTNFNDSTVPAILDESSPMNIAGLINYIHPSPINPEVIRDETLKTGWFADMLRMPHSMFGGGGKSGDSFALFSGKIGEANNVLKLQTDRLQSFQKALFDGWKCLTIHSLGGQANEGARILSLDQDIQGVGDGESVKVNEMIGYDAEKDEPIVKNDFNKVQCNDILILTTKKTEYAKAVEREQYLGYLQGIPPSLINNGIRAMFEIEIAINMPSISEDAKKNLEIMKSLTVAYAKNNLILLNAQTEAQIVQIQAQLDQMKNAIMQQSIGMGQEMAGQQPQNNVGQQQGVM